MTKATIEISSYLGLFSRAIWNRLLTNFSDSPSHFETRSDDEMERKVELSASVATAFARYDFPVPGGPYNKMPLHGFRFPLKRWGNLMGRMTASFNASFACSSPATSDHFTFGVSTTIAPDSWSLNLLFSLSWSVSPPPSFTGFLPEAASSFLVFSPLTCDFNFSARSRY